MSGQQDRLSKEEHERIFREKVLPEAELDTYTPQEHPKAIILAGQPGAGKGGLRNATKIEFKGDIFAVDPDEQREYHTEAERWQQESPYGWSQRTNADAGGFASGLRDAAVERRVNLLVDTTLGDARNATRLIQGLQEAGYEVEIRAVAAHRLESEHGIDFRFTDKIDDKGVARDVPLDFHDKVYRDLPDNLDSVRDATGAPVRIYDRSVAELYDSRRDLESASAVLREARDARLQDPEVTQQLRERWQTQADWHRELPERIARHELDISPATADALLHEQLERNRVELSAQRSEAAATIDELARPGAPPARMPVPEPPIPGLRRAGATASLAGFGAAASAYDAHQTGERVSTLLAQDNRVAAQSELTHFGARGIGGWAGGTAAAAVVGTSGLGPVALVAADAYLLSEAFDRGATLLDNRRIYHQTDREGVTWKFNGRDWLRQDLADLTTDTIDNPMKGQFSALPEKARELNYLANSEAVQQAMGKVHPRNPYVLPADESDRAHLYQRDWRHDPDSGTWSRQVADEVDHNDRPIWQPETANVERTNTLNQQAARVIDENITTGSVAIAAHYELAYHQSGSKDFGSMPQAVQTALNPDNVQASNGQQYQRDAQGQWRHDSEVAQGNTALELEATRERLQPALAQHAQTIASLPERTTLTPEQQDRANLRTTYDSLGVTPNPERMEAIHTAVQRTRQVNGIDAATTSVAIERNAHGVYDVDSPLQHLRRDGNNVVQVAAVTTAEDIHRALDEVRARGRNEVAPAPTRPAQQIEAPTPQERGAQEQALHEAQRRGLSQEQVQHVTHEAAAQVRAPDQTTSVHQETQSGPAQAAPAMSGAGHGSNRRKEDEQPDVRVPHHAAHQAPGFPSDHRDFALFEAIRRQLPEGVSDEKAAEVTYQAKINGIRNVDKLDQIIVQDDKVWVAGKTIGDMARVDLSTPAPALQDTLHQSETFDRQRTQQLTQWQEMDRQQSQNVSAPGMSLSR